MWFRNLLPAVAALVLSSSASTGAQPAAPPVVVSPELQESCERLAPLDPNGVRRILELFAGSVLGKPAERWTAQDFDTVRATASACNRYVNAKRQEVKAGTWAVHMNGAQKVVLPISDEMARVDGETASLRRSSPWLPQCSALIEWRRDRRTWKTNADTIFGRDFLDMGRDDLETAKKYVPSCVTVVDMIGVARRIKGRVGKLIVDDVVYAIEKAQDASEEAPKGREVKMLEVTDGTRRIPLAYLSPQSRMMVGIVNRSLHLDRSLSTDELNEVMRWAEKVISDNDSDVEIAYAKAVKEYVARQVFRR